MSEPKTVSSEEAERIVVEKAKHLAANAQSFGLPDDESRLVVQALSTPGTRLVHSDDLSAGTSMPFYVCGLVFLENLLVKRVPESIVENIIETINGKTKESYLDVIPELLPERSKSELLKLLGTILEAKKGAEKDIAGFLGSLLDSKQATMALGKAVFVSQYKEPGRQARYLKKLARGTIKEDRIFKTLSTQLKLSLVVYRESLDEDDCERFFPAEGCIIGPKRKLFIGKDQTFTILYSCELVKELCLDLGRSLGKCVGLSKNTLAILASESSPKKILQNIVAANADISQSLARNDSSPLFSPLLDLCVQACSMVAAEDPGMEPKRKFRTGLNDLLGEARKMHMPETAWNELEAALAKMGGSLRHARSSALNSPARVDADVIVAASERLPSRTSPTFENGSAKKRHKKDKDRESDIPPEAPVHHWHTPKKSEDSDKKKAPAVEPMQDSGSPTKKFGSIVPRDEEEEKKDAVPLARKQITCVKCQKEKKVDEVRGLNCEHELCGDCLTG